MNWKANEGSENTKDAFFNPVSPLPVLSCFKICLLCLIFLLGRYWMTTM